MDQFNDPNPHPGASPSHRTPPQETSGMAVTSLVLGILGFFLWILTALPAIILGIIALVKINKSGGRLGGSGLAIGGITTGAISLLCCGLLLPALLLPAVQAAREAGERVESMNKMKEINEAILENYDIMKSFPVAGEDAAGNRPNLSWRVHILRFTEHQSLYEQFHLEEPWDSEHNLSLIPLMPPMYQNPSVAEEGKTNYLAVTGPGAVFEGRDPGPRKTKIVDGTSNTIWLVEADADQAVEWTRPDDWEYDPADPWRGLGKLRPGVVLVAFLDGSVRAIDTSTSDEDLSALVTRDGGERVELPGEGPTAR